MPKLPDFLKVIRGDWEKDDDQAVDVLFSDAVGRDETGRGISAYEFGQGLMAIPKKKPVNLLLNSLGGNVGEGTAMCSMIASRGNVTTCVIGWAASMGALLSQAGVKRKMMPGTMMLIHNPYGNPGAGDYRAMEQKAEFYKQVRDNMVSYLADRTGNSKKKIGEMMDAETLMSAEQAKDLGFCDEVVQGDPTWNRIEKIPFSQAVKSLRSLAGEITPPSNQPIETKSKIMKSLIAALARHKLIPTADMTDEAAICVALENGIAPFLQLQADNTNLKAGNQKFEAGRKTRVETLVVNAIETEKIIKPERKQALIDMGMTDESSLVNYLTDIRAVATEAKPGKGNRETPVPRFGAPAVPPAKANSEDDIDQQIKDLQAELKTCRDPKVRSDICTQLRELRGRGELFTSEDRRGRP